MRFHDPLSQGEAKAGSAGLSRAAAVPSEKGREHVRQLRVFVDAGGKALDAAVIVDPGHGFASQAVRCAIGKRWSPALDREGIPMRATAIVRVRFTR